MDRSAHAATDEHEAIDGHFRFVEWTMAVILGVLLVEVPESLRGGSYLSSVAALLLLTAMLVFVEMYLVLRLYHRSAFTVPYRLRHLSVDLGIGLTFVGFIVLVGSRHDDGSPVVADVELGLALGLVLLGLLLLRQLMVLAVVRVDNATAYLERRGQLASALFGNVVGLVLLALVWASLGRSRFGLGAVTWSRVALLVFLGYALFAHAVYEPHVAGLRTWPQRCGRSWRDYGPRSGLTPRSDDPARPPNADRAFAKASTGIDDIDWTSHPC